MSAWLLRRCCYHSTSDLVACGIHTDRSAYRRGTHTSLLINALQIERDEDGPKQFLPKVNNERGWVAVYNVVAAGFNGVVGSSREAAGELMLEVKNVSVEIAADATAAGDSGKAVQVTVCACRHLWSHVASTVAQFLLLTLMRHMASLSCTATN